MIAALAGTMSGAASGSEVVDHYQDWTTPTNTGQFVVAINPGLFRPTSEFQRALDVRLHEIRSSTPMPGVKTVLVPGDRSAASRRSASLSGIELPDSVLGELQDLALRFGAVDRLDS